MPTGASASPPPGLVDERAGAGRPAPLAAMLVLAHAVEPALAPLARRTRPLPAGARVALALGLAAALLVLTRRSRTA